MSTLELSFPKTDIVGVKFLGHDGRAKGYLDEPWDAVPSDKELFDKKTYFAKLMPTIDREAVHKGDIVVVSCRTGFQLCKVHELDAYKPEDYALSLVVARVDMDAFNAYVQREKDKARLRKQIEAKKNELEKRAIYDILAEKDADFASMLKLFGDLGGTLE